MEYIDSKSLENLTQEVNKIQLKYPDHIPCLITKTKGTRDILPDLSFIKYLCRRTEKFGILSFGIRKRLKIAPETAIFLFVDNTIPSPSEDIESVYQRHKHQSGYLLITYSGESTFGTKRMLKKF